MVPPSSHRVPRARWYSGYCLSSFFTFTGLSPSMVGFPTPFYLVRRTFDSPNPESITTLGLASFPFARRYLGNRFFFLFLRLLRCFSSAGLPPPYYFIHMAVIGHEPNCVSTFGHLRVKRIFAPNRSFSQLITSFFGSWCLGILPTLFVA